MFAQNTGYFQTKLRSLFFANCAALLGIVVSITAFVLCSGCAAPLGASSGSSAAETAAAKGAGGTVSSIVGNPSIFDITARSTKIAFLSPAALLSNNSSIASQVVREQCRFDTPDPVFFVPDESKQLNWTFAGRLDKKPYFQAAEYRSLFTLGLMSGPLQVNTWPLQLTSLADMPHLFLEQRLDAVGRAQLNPMDRRELVEEYMQQEHRIQNVVMGLMNSYNQQTECHTAAK
jgi:hypothetical protein